jgi:hypothetical protein
LLEQGSRVRGVGREILRTSSKGVRLNTLLARSPGADIIKLGKKLAPAHLSTCKLLCCHKVFKVTVICEYSNWGSSALEFSTPGFEGANNSKEFLVVDFVVTLRRVEFAAHKSYGV